MNKQEELEAQTVTETGAPATRRVATAEAAYSVFRRFLEADDMDAQRRWVIQGMIDGNPPYVEQELIDAGLGGMINVNFMSMRANLDTRAGAAHELFMEVPTLIELAPAKSNEDEAYNQRDVDHIGGVIAEEFSRTVRDWSGFLSTMDLVFRESDAYGLGYAVFEDEWTWRPRAYKRGTLLVDPAAPVDLDENEVVVVRGTIPAGKLFQIIEDPKRAREEGWNVTGIEMVLKDVFLKGDNGKAEDQFQRSIRETIQQLARNSALVFQENQFESVKIAHILVKEVSGDQKITHLIIPESDNNKLFLYERPGRYASMSKALWWLPYNYGDGYVRSVRGVGSWMAQHDDLSNRYLCRVFDAGFMLSSLILQPATQFDLGRLNMVQHGPFTIVPPELKAIQTSFQPQLAPLIQLREVGENVMRNNTGLYRQHPETFSDGAPKTARQVAEEVSKEARLEKAAIAHRYVHYERLYREMLRRMVDAARNTDEWRQFDGKADARKFYERCIARGVPRDLLNKYDEYFLVTATQAIGLGSLGVRMDITNQVLDGALKFGDSEGAVHAFRDWLAARVGTRNVDKYRPPVSRDQVPSDAMSLATLENNDLAQGQQAVAAPEQLHRIHVSVHSQMVVPILQAIAQQQVQDPQAAYTALVTAAQHLQDHYQYVARVPQLKQEADELEKLLQACSKAAGQLEQALRQLHREQQQQQEEQAAQLSEAQQVLADRELQAKIYEINRKYELEGMKQASLNRMRAEKTAAQLQIAQQRAQADIALKRDRQNAELAAESEVE